MRLSCLVWLLVVVGCARSTADDIGLRLLDSSAGSGGDARAGSSGPNAGNDASTSGGSNGSTQGGNATGGGSAANTTSGGDGGGSSTGGNQGAGVDAGTCTNTQSDPNNCGSCGQACPTAASGCLSGRCQFGGCTWREHAGDSYLFCNSKIGQSWAASRSFCQSLGMDLTVLETAAEDAFVALNIVDHWIGASDLDVEGQWRWIVPGGATNGALFWQGKADGAAQAGVFTNWFSLDPNDANAGEDCARLLSSDWWDEACSGDKGLVCEVVRP